jgi:RHS repeat-associated protein
MRKIYLLALLIVFNISAITAQNVDYSTPLYTNETFSKIIDTSLPVGHIQASGGVSASGAATYSIPLGLPPGTNGASPSLTLDYNSMGGNGILGAGWSVSSLSNISRSGQTVYHDGKITPVDLSTNDRFTWDGQQLISITGIYGATGSTYGTESESFASITSNGLTGAGPTWFKIVSKDGTEMEFGNTTDSRIMNTSNTDVLLWKVNKVKYADGNYITFKYIFDDRDSRIDEINYTGNADAVPILLPYNKIKFSYKIRSDVNTQYIASSPLLSKYLLDKITITSENQNVKSYDFKYGWDNINSYLREIVESGSDGAKLNSTIFKYGQPPLDYQPALTGLSEQESIDVFSGDFNGDGKSDILAAAWINSGIAYYNYHTGFKVYYYQEGTSAYQQGASQSLPANYSLIKKEKIPNDYNILTGDYTGDGLDDVLTLKITNTGSYSKLDSVVIYESINGGTSFAQHRRSVQPNFFKIHSSGNYFFPGDFDGDGISEYITILGNVNDIYAAFLCTNYLTGGACGSIGTSGTVNIPISQWATADKIYVIDFDGDGKSELMIIKEFNTEIFTFDGYTARSIYYSGFPTKNHLIYFGDFNADRKTDLLVRNSLNNNSAAWTKAISMGNNYVESPFSFVQTPDITSEYYKNHNLNLADFNGDGKTDIYHGKNTPANDGSKLDVYYSQGDSFHHIQSNHFETVGYVSSFVLDLDGDGRAEVLNRKYYADPFLIYQFKPSGKEHLIHRIADGIGHVSTWYYKTLSQGGTFYAKGGSSIYPLNNIQPPLYAAYQFLSQNGIGGETTIQYNYEDGRLHRKGKGFLGFGKVTASNLTTGLKIVSENEFNITYYAASPKKTSTFLISGNTLLTEISQVNEFIPQGGTGSLRYLYRLKSSSENNVFEGRTTSAINDTFDSFGNITKRTENNNNVETTITNTIYGAYLTSIPNRPTSVTTKNTRSGQSEYSVTIAYEYNSKGQLTSKTDFNGLPKSVTTSYGYNDLGNPISSTVTSMGLTSRSSSMVYDGKGRYPESVTNALGQVVSSTYDAKWGKPLTTTGIDGLTTTFEYDVFGRTKKTILPEGYSILESGQWDISGNTVWYSLFSHPGKPDVKTWFDKLGRSIKTETESFGGQWVTQIQTFDAKGNLASSTQPYKSGETVITTTNNYDAYNRVSSSTNSIGTNTYTYAYSSGNLTTTTTNLAGQTSSKVTDATERTISVTDNGGTISYTYFSHGGIKENTNSSTILTSSLYDDYGRQTLLTDKNAGTTTYIYNALGELTSQTNAKNEISTINYNVLGQVTSKTGTEGTISYEYYNSGTSVNEIKKVTGFSGDLKEYTYDGFGRTLTVKETVDGNSYTTTYEHNIYGDITSTVYPSGFGIKNAYDNNGFPTTIKNIDETITFYTNTGINGQQQVTAYSLGNGKSSSVVYEYGMPTRFFTSGVQDLNLTWNYQNGNLNKRKDDVKNKEENFIYDNLNRLQSATIIGSESTAISLTYSSNGNISSKTDAGSYSYNASKVHAVAGVSNPSSIVPSIQQDIVYNTFMQPEQVTENGYELTYTYGSNYERNKSVLKQNGSVINTRYYLGGYEKDITGGTTRYIQYIGSAAGLVAIVVSEGSTHTPYYTYTDHQGSVLSVTNTNGTIVSEQNFDAWGRRRTPTTWIALLPTASTGLPVWLYRGYTGHEHLDNFGLINMNGRLYDPVLGRMLSPDNFIQDPSFTQSYNRYSYAWNNPLKYTDPSGQVLFWDNVILGAVGGVFNVVTNLGSIKSVGQGFGFFGVGFASGFVAGYGQIAASGAILNAGNTALAGKSFQEIAVSAVSGAATSTIGAVIGGAVSPYLNKVIPQTVSPVLRRGLTNMATGAVVGALLGGGSAAATGGDFWGGFGSGAGMGAVGGAVSGISQGFTSAGRLGVNPWTGKPIKNYASTEFPSGNKYTIPLPEGATITAKTLRSFTAGNFRVNLSRLTGGAPANSQAHHVFPKKFINQFSERGININDPRYGAWWESQSHLKNASNYNSIWEQYLQTNPTKSMILDKGRVLMQQQGIHVNY